MSPSPFPFPSPSPSLSLSLSSSLSSLSLSILTLKSDSAGLVAGLAEKASELKLGMGADDLPVVVLEFDTG